MGGESVTVLDTNALLWLAMDDSRLGKKAVGLADRALADDSLAVSAITFWEVSTLCQRGRLDLFQPIEAWRSGLLELGLLEIPVTGDIGIDAAAHSDSLRDPADRIIVATAARAGALLLTSDERILEWKGSLRRQDARL
jgi:PIN domain nuclease of toxin-antitoxin system